MKVVACRLPDGSCARVCPVPQMLAWMQAGRSLEERKAFLEAHTAQGFSAAEVARYMMDMDDAEREIGRRVRDGLSLDVATRYAYALKSGGLSEDEALMLLALVNVPDAEEYLITEQVEVTTKDYRHCYVPRAGKMEWDMPKAREHHRGLIRSARKQVFAQLDGERASALRRRDNAEVAAVDEKAQIWADAPADPRIDAAGTVTELMRVWPEE